MSNQNKATEEAGKIRDLLAIVEKTCPGEWTAGAVYGDDIHTPHWHILDMNGQVIMDTANSHYGCADWWAGGGESGPKFCDTGTGDIIKLVAALRNHAAAMLSTETPDAAYLRGHADGMKLAAAVGGVK